MKNLLIVILLLTLTLTGCTENERARSWGGESTVNLPTGRKLARHKRYFRDFTQRSQNHAAGG